MTGSPLLEVKGLSFSYDGGSAVLRDIGFQVEPGEVFVILGANGAGKSTLLNCIGGERQQAQITRVLVQEPRLILLDEPTNHLDYGNQLKIVKTVSQLAAEGVAVVMTTHMPDHAILLNGSAGLMGADGRMTSGPAGSVISEAALRELYHTNLHLVYVDPLGRMACVAGKL